CTGARRSATASTSSMLRWFSPKMTGSDVALIMGIPKRVEIEPLQRCFQAACRQCVGITLHPLRDDGVALAAAPLDTFGEGLQVYPVAVAVLQAEQQVDRTFQQSGQQPRPLGEGCRLAEELCGGGACAV